MSTSDEGRAAVYAAEIAAFEGTSYEAITAFESLVALAFSVVDAARGGRTDRSRCDGPGPTPSSSSARQLGSGAPVVRLAAPQMTPATLVHELAHALAGVAAGHGPAIPAGPRRPRRIRVR